MIAVTCRCGKTMFDPEAPEKEFVRCGQCGGPAPAGPTPSAEDANPGAARRGRDALYWVLLLALLPLVTALFREGDTPARRLERTLRAHPELKPRIESLLASGTVTLDDLLKALPGRRLDDRALLPRDSTRHQTYAALSAAAFFLLVGVLMAGGVARPWHLALAALFTATFGVACLFVLHDVVGHGYQFTLARDRGFVENLLGFTLVVGLGEELCKSLPVLFYVRTLKPATWRGACLWGMASGVGFGVAEAVMYSARTYNGIQPGEVYLTRFVSCVALHAVWSASVGITLFRSRGLLNKVLGAVLYGGDFAWQDLAGPLLRVLGVAMALHGLYDTLLTRDLILPALLTALVSFAWLGWQIETGREDEARIEASFAST
jgi:RsiW-degrading membrane proteinase PrsW (M82 family)